MYKTQRYRLPCQKVHFCISLSKLLPFGEFLHITVFDQVTFIQGAANQVQVFTNKFVVYLKFLEAVLNFVSQYNILFLLSFVYSNSTFFNG